MDWNGETKELRTDDPKRFSALRDLVRDDISDRKDWKVRADKNRELRFKKTATKKPIYEGAPNIAEPIIDDLIRELKTAEVTILWQGAKLAQFVGIDAAGVQFAAQAEQVFDFHLRNSKRTRSRIAQIIDDRLCFGFGVAKLIPAKGRGGLKVPEFVKVSPYSLIVPTATDEMGEAERVCHIMRYTHSEFWRTAREDGWDKNAARTVLKKLAEKYGSTSAGTLSALDEDEDGESRARWRDGKLPESQGTITLWEIYYHAADTGPRVCLLSPDAPELPLYDRAWTWPAIQIETTMQTQQGPAQAIVFETDVPERPWPFVQFRNEDADGFYNTRGVPEVVETDQKEASSYRTVRAIALDFCGKPFLSGAKKSVNPFKFRAGDYLDGQSIVWADSPIQQQIYSQDFARSMAARRVGSPQGATSSMDMNRDKKTATEVQTQTRISAGMSADAVDRFAEPFADLFGQMWTYARREAQNNGGKTGLTSVAQLPLEAWAAEYCISAGVSGRTANQWQMLANMATILPYLQAFPSVAQFVQGGALGRWLFNLVDAELAKKVMADGSGLGAPIEQVVAQLGQVVGKHNQYLAEIAKTDAGTGGENVQAGA